MAELSIPVLAYHAGNISGNTYASNDRIAFASDLYTLHHQGYQIIPLQWIAEWVNGQRDLSVYGDKLVGLSCDDGLDQDYLDGAYFDFGPQRSLFHILQDFVEDVGPEQQAHAHLTAFVIASPQARQAIDEQSLSGAQLLNHHWWREANQHSRFSVENHSWDHRHPDIYPADTANFTSVTDASVAEQQIIDAKHYIDQELGENTTLFCYPWGHYNDYLLHEFMPTRAAEHGITAAFTCEASHTKRGSNRWLMPRYVCGFNWKSPAQLITQVLSS